MAQKAEIKNKLRLSYWIGMALALMATMAPQETIAGKNTIQITYAINAEIVEMQAPAASPQFPGDTIFIVVEQRPEFPGGEEARIQFIVENLRYPLRALEAGIQGNVFVTFVVEKDGSITDVKVLRGVGGCLDEEAVRVVKSMPRWIPGRQGDQPVRVQFTMPFRFVRILRTIEFN
ncbi:MAG TPA: energy transducer TonB [Bacteroidales bacterium]|nr:energy transducer TonB [Bacteroidales bacterium]